ncbi:MAG: hypothetical protein HQ547_06940 [Candidatus Omnitrophica bacterium]|nr:hypothetical protein [Candidatus Omnitrophota bacterium]
MHQYKQSLYRILSQQAVSSKLGMPLGVFVISHFTRLDPTSVDRPLISSACARSLFSFCCKIKPTNPKAKPKKMLARAVSEFIINTPLSIYKMIHLRRRFGK